MKKLTAVTAVILAFGLSACANTWDGVKEDGHDNKERVEHGAEHVKDKTEQTWDKTKDATRAGYDKAKEVFNGQK